MISVEVILPDGKRGKGRVDPSAPWAEILEDIVRGFDLGNPKDFRIGLLPLSLQQPPQGYILSPGDVIHIYKARDLRGPAFERED